MAKTPNKIDKRTKEYRDSLKKRGIGHTSYTIPKKQADAMLKEFEDRREKGISMAIIMPDIPNKTSSHQSQIEQLQEQSTEHNRLINDLLVRIGKLETIVG